MYYKKLSMPKYKVRSHGLKAMEEVEKHAERVFKLLQSYRRSLKGNDGYIAIEYVYDSILYIMEIAHMFGILMNSRVVYEEGTILGAVINAFQDECRPDAELVKRIMRGKKKYNDEE